MRWTYTYSKKGNLYWEKLEPYYRNNTPTTTVDTNSYIKYFQNIFLFYEGVVWINIVVSLPSKLTQFKSPREAEGRKQIHVKRYSMLFTFILPSYQTIFLLQDYQNPKRKLKVFLKGYTVAMITFLS